jgi:hypothetical protein
MTCGCKKSCKCSDCPLPKKLIVGQRRIIGSHLPDPKGNQRKNCCCSFFPKDGDLFLNCDPEAEPAAAVYYQHCWYEIPRAECGEGDCDLCPKHSKRSCIDCRFKVCEDLCEDNLRYGDKDYYGHSKPVQCKPLPPKCFDVRKDTYTCSDRHAVGCGTPERVTKSQTNCCYVAKDGDLYIDILTGNRYVFVNHYWRLLPAIASGELPSFCSKSKCKYIVSEKIAFGKGKIGKKASREICCLCLQCGDLFIDCETGQYFVVLVSATTDFYQKGIEHVAEELPQRCLMTGVPV